MNFTYEALPGRVVFGPGMRRTIAEQADASGGARIMIVASRRDAGLVAEMCELLGDRVVGRFDDIAQHVPVAKAEIARDVARSLAADTVITIGGGSATGFGKAIALEVDVSLIAVPTTYSGSEMTTIYGLTADGDKRTGRSPRVKPGIVVYDPELTADLPPRIAGPSGM
ncbi:MAG: iron-containing alcohol dehydrogenase, partial [Ilumatobacteraceae bacterium]